jgi:hypothetical protein
MDRVAQPRPGRRSVAAAATVGLAIALLASAVLPAAAFAAVPGNRDALTTYARDTWRSMVAMTYPSGLTADNIDADTRVPARYTSPTNIGSYLWSTLTARDLGIIGERNALGRIRTTIRTLERLERHTWSGQFYNWYDPENGAKLLIWPNDGSTVYPFLSSVDNGWLAASLIMVANAVPELRQRARALARSIDFGFYYDESAGLIRGGFWADPPPQCNIPGNYRRDERGAEAGPDVYYTCHHYGAFNTEPRIASYIGIAEEQIPARHYWKGWRTFPDTCDWGWQEMKPQGRTVTYAGRDIEGRYSVDVYEGHYTYRGRDFVPTWGGSMFEALMVPLLVPEEQWGPHSWGINHPLYVRGQIDHGLREADYGYWGFSPSNNPAGGYREYGVDPLGMEPNGYASDQERTYVDYGFGECRPAQPAPTSYGQGVVTPHASFLALDFAEQAAMRNLANLKRDFDAYGWGGFYDAINVGDPETGEGRGQASRHYLALDQGMVMLATGNALLDDQIQRYFARAVEDALKPLMSREVFTAGE